MNVALSFLPSFTLVLLLDSFLPRFSRLSTFLTVRNALLGGGGGGGAGGAVGGVGGRGRWGNATETIVKGRTVLSWMDELATAWQDLPVLGVGIADYGPGTVGRKGRKGDREKERKRDREKERKREREKEGKRERGKHFN